MKEIQEILKFTKSLTLLYVEDNDELRFRNEEIFVLYFREVISISNAADALQCYRDRKASNGRYFDIVITDIEMPHTNGITLCRQLLDEHSQQKIIALSAHNEANYLFELINIGISNYILKPITVQSLNEALYTAAKSIYDQRLIRHRTLQIHNLNQEFKKTISDLNSALEYANEATKEKDLFLANISHEIRTPMNGILGLGELLSKTDLDEKQTSYLSKIQHSSKVLLGIVNDILDFSKIEAGKMSIESIPFNLNEILEHLADMISPKAHEKNLDLAFDIDQNVPPHLIGDPLRIGQILLNLLNNAVKFTEKGAVLLKISMPKGEGITRIIRFDVIDSGVGLSDEQSSRLFSAFSQAQTSTTRLYGGTGLGLSISRQLSSLLGGDIALQSRLGEGSTFSLSIPLELAYPQERRLYRLPSPAMLGKNILILDNHTEFAHSLAKKLHYFRCDVDIYPVCTPDMFFEHYDVIMVDIDNLSQLNALSASLRPEIHYILLGNHFQLLGELPAHTLTIAAHLTKPCTQQMLFELLVKLSNHSPSILSNRSGFRQDISNLKGSKILLAEDNAINQQIISELLENTGIEVTIAENGFEALKLLENHPFDLVLMDLQMPIMGGYQAVQIIRSQQRYDNVPVIALSANVSEHDREAIMISGMQGQLGKPFQIDAFYDILLRFLSPKKDCTYPHIAL